MHAEQPLFDEQYLSFSSFDVFVDEKVRIEGRRGEWSKMKVQLFLVLFILLPSIDSLPRRFGEASWWLMLTFYNNIGGVDFVPAPEEAGVEWGWGGGDRHQVDGRRGRVHPRIQDRLGDVPLHHLRLIQDRLLGAQEVWEVVALLHQNPSLGEHTALQEGRLLDRLHLDTEPAGEPRFQVELEG